jgi:hypothetical protein
MTAPLRRQHLATVAATLRGGALLDADDAKRIADALDQIVQGVAADVAFGFRLKPGQHRTQAQIAARDDLLRQTARTFWPDASATEQARQLSDALARYRDGRWRHDRVAVECPHPVGALTAHLWRLLRHRDRAIGKRQMHRIVTSARLF